MQSVLQTDKWSQTWKSGTNVSVNLNKHCTSQVNDRKYHVHFNPQNISNLRILIFYLHWDANAWRLVIYCVREYQLLQAEMVGFLWKMCVGWGGGLKLTISGIPSKCTSLCGTYSAALVISASNLHAAHLKMIVLKQHKQFYIGRLYSFA